MTPNFPRLPSSSIRLLMFFQVLSTFPKKLYRYKEEVCMTGLLSKRSWFHSPNKVLILLWLFSASILLASRKAWDGSCQSYHWTSMEKGFGTRWQFATNEHPVAWVDPRCWQQVCVHVIILPWDCFRLHFKISFGKIRILRCRNNA